MKPKPIEAFEDWMTSLHDIEKKNVIPPSFPENMYSMFYRLYNFADASGLKEAEHVRNLQERLVRELQQYTTANYPTMPSKFADLLLRVPELHRVCQVNYEFYVGVLWWNLQENKPLIACSNCSGVGKWALSAQKGPLKSQTETRKLLEGMKEKKSSPQRGFQFALLAN